MKGAIDISWGMLALGYLLMFIPLYFFYKYKTGLVKPTTIAVIRMSFQLFMVGLYLEYIFKWDNPYINLMWIIIMILVSTYTVITRAGLKLRLFFLPIMTATLLSIVFIDYYVLGFIIGLKNILTARYFIPITGMLLGNSLKNVVIALDAFYQRVSEEEIAYRWQLANGAKRDEALLPFMSYALHKAFNPLIATAAVMGLIALPGMMTGQILGGSDPMVAIKYQITILIVVFSSTMLNVWLTIVLANRMAFDAWDNFNRNIFRK